MNKFSLLFITFVFLGGIVASDAPVDKVAQVTLAPDAPKAADVAPEVVPATTTVVPLPAQTVVVTQEAPVVTVTQEAPKAVVVTQEAAKPVVVTTSVVPAPAPVEQDKEALSVSASDKLKVFLGGFLVKAQDVGSVVKYYLLGDVLTDLLSKKGFIVTPDAGLMNAYVNGVTPRRLMNLAFVVAIVNGVYFGYKLLSKDQDEDDFFLDEEDEELE